MKKILITAGILLAIIVIAGTTIINLTTKDVDTDNIVIDKIDIPISDAEIRTWNNEEDDLFPPPPPERKELEKSSLPETPNMTQQNTKSKRDRRREEWEKRMNDPEFKEKMQRRMQRGMARKYEQLMDYLGLNDEEKNEFIKMVTEKNSELMALGREFLGRRSEGEEVTIAEEVREKFEKINKEYLQAMNDYLGDEAYEIYVQYEATQPERSYVERVNKELSEENTETLTTEQQDLLITSMYEQRQALGIENIPGNITSMTTLPDDSMFTEEGRAQQKEQMETLQKAYISTAAEILSEDQLQEFTKTVTQQNRRGRR